MAMSVVYTTVAGRIVHENRGGVERFYGQDPLGSTAALYDSTGTKTDEYAYWPYGEIRSHSGSSTTPFTFVGTLGYYMDQADQLYVRARYLLTALARWLTVDPLWPREKAYGYAASRPAVLTDLSGLTSSAECIQDCRDVYSNAVQQIIWNASLLIIVAYAAYVASVFACLASTILVGACLFAVSLVFGAALAAIYALEKAQLDGALLSLQACENACQPDVKKCPKPASPANSTGRTNGG